jgi:hypothetical protein
VLTGLELGLGLVGTRWVTGGRAAEVATRFMSLSTCGGVVGVGVWGYNRVRVGGEEMMRKDTTKGALLRCCRGSRKDD